MRLTVRAAGILALAAMLVVSGCSSGGGSKPVSRGVAAKLDKETESMLERESRASFDFFWNEANREKGSKGYGLVADRAPGNPGLSSVASTGFGLSALVIGAERGWVSRKEAEERALGTMRTLLDHAAKEHGFLYHFLNLADGTRAPGSEVSVIDTAIALNGAITAGSYFGGEVQKAAEALAGQVEWPWYIDPANQQFYMGYSPENGFAGHWDFYAEQLMMYVLAAGSASHPVPGDLFYKFQRDTRPYKDGEPFIHSWFGSIFTYQFSHAWFDFRGMKDREGVDWWVNSVRASEASRAYAGDMAATYSTFGTDAWGITASDGPGGYNGLYGSPPSGFDDTAHTTDGTLAPAGALGSIVFTPEASIAALKHFAGKSELWGKYGLTDAYNEAVSPAWVGPDVIGIDKGITLLMIENYRSGLIWEMYMKSSIVQAGAKAVGLSAASR
ncbi:glucoamylase family protein [Paenibacillus gansuensis]|uniref:Glucoamylase family protein n=1 Tax=Paenibacillus gansuensis TaxID=306542 RepID=A0ABW5PLK2_9BACL